MSFTQLSAFRRKPSRLLAVLVLATLSWVHPSSATRLWSDPASWTSGTVPNAGANVLIDGTTPMVLDVNAQVNTLSVEPGAKLQFAPGGSHTLSSTGNVIIEGVLEMKPSTASQIHTLKITGANESTFVGGGMTPLSTDAGVWVVGGGRVDLQGAEKLAWARADGSIASAATSITLDAVPTGWNVGDEIVITPTGTAAVSNSATQFDLRTITAISGSTITINAGTTYSHPAVMISSSQTMTAEVLNLTRNVRIEGMPPATRYPRPTSAANSPGRSHFFIHNHMPAVHSIRHAAVRYMGPRKTNPDGSNTSVDFVGRYGIHFHHCMENSEGTLVEGVVVRDTDSHAFVPHASHGITFNNCISYDTTEDAYWWDKDVAGTPVSNATSHDIVYNRCVAALVNCDPVFRGYSLTGYLLGIGIGNEVINCVAVGIQGNSTASGFHWPSAANHEDNVWLFEDNVSHNNRANGVYVWQNDYNLHEIHGFVAYRNQNTGIEHGAYTNSYFWNDVALSGNGWNGRAGGIQAQHIRHNASLIAGVTGRNQFQDFTANGDGISSHIVHIDRSQARSLTESLYLRWKVSGYTSNVIYAYQMPANDTRADGSPIYSLIDFVDWTVGVSDELEPTHFDLVRMAPGSRIRVQRRNGTAYQLTPKTADPTQFDLTNIPAFYPY